MEKISCIIPTYNEEARIGAVLEIASQHPLIDEVIVVDDGSKDNTCAIVSNFLNVILITHDTNKGKSVAVHTGIKASKGTYVLLLDADLMGLNKENITHLISPVANKIADVSISLRRNAPSLWHRIGFDYISGERVMPKSILTDHLDEIIRLPRFGLEVFFNRWIIHNHCKIKIVSWPNVDSPFKYKKYGLYKGIKSDVKMMLDIFRTISIIGPIYQIMKMKKQIVS